MHIFLAIVGFLLFIGLILAHEWGHFKVARRNGVDVEEFGLGIPPRAGGKRLKSGMLLSINWLPLGGFVKLKGEHDADTGKGAYGAASLWAKTKIMLAGVGMNLLIAIGLFIVIGWIGVPSVLPPELGQQFTVKADEHPLKQEVRVTSIEKGSPADKAGLKVRDSILRLTAAVPCEAQQSCGNSVKYIKTADDLHRATQAFAGLKVRVTGVRENGQEYTSKMVTLRSPQEIAAAQKAYKASCNSSGNNCDTSLLKGYLGVSQSELSVTRYTWSAPIVAIGLTKQLTVLTFKGLGTAVHGLGSLLAGATTGNKEARQNGQTQATEQTGGIVAIGVIIWTSGSLGISFMLMVIAIISLTLAIMNILPIPALDGGRLFVTYLYRLMRRPLTPAREERIHGTGMACLLVLFALITVVDVRRFF